MQKADLPAVVAQMKQRFDREAPSQAKELWSAAYILMGLRYESAMVQSLLRGVVNMKESSTYQAILEEGEAIGKTLMSVATTLAQPGVSHRMMSGVMPCALTIPKPFRNNTYSM